MARMWTMERGMAPSHTFLSAILAVTEPLCLTFFICKMEIIMPTSRGCVRNKLIYLQILRTFLGTE